MLVSVLYKCTVSGSHLLQQHVGGTAELTEELLQVPLPGPGGHVACDWSIVKILSCYWLIDSYRYTLDSHDCSF